MQPAERYFFDIAFPCLKQKRNRSSCHSPWIPTARRSMRVTHETSAALRERYLKFTAERSRKKRPCVCEDRGHTRVRKSRCQRLVPCIECRSPKAIRGNRRGRKN